MPIRPLPVQEKHFPKNRHLPLLLQVTQCAAIAEHFLTEASMDDELKQQKQQMQQQKQQMQKLWKRQRKMIQKSRILYQIPNCRRPEAWQQVDPCPSISKRAGVERLVRRPHHSRDPLRVRCLHQRYHLYAKDIFAVVDGLLLLYPQGRNNVLVVVVAVVVDVVRRSRHRSPIDVYER